MLRMRTICQFSLYFLIWNKPWHFSAEQAKLLEELGSEAKSVPQLNTSNEWIYFGPYVRFKPIYESPFMEPIKAAKSIYICEFCLTPLVDCILFKNHIVIQEHLMEVLPKNFVVS